MDSYKPTKKRRTRREELFRLFLSSCSSFLRGLYQSSTVSIYRADARQAAARPFREYSWEEYPPVYWPSKFPPRILRPLALLVAGAQSTASTKSSRECAHPGCDRLRVDARRIQQRPISQPSINNRRVARVARHHLNDRDHHASRMEMPMAPRICPRWFTIT